MRLSPLLKKTGMVALLASVLQMPAGAQAISEDFDNITTLPAAGWSQTNKSNPLGTGVWSQGNPANFNASNGATNSYITVLYTSTTATGVGTISNWLIGPNRTFKNGDVISFESRIPAGTEYPDRLELRLSTAGTSTNVGTSETSVGDFSTLLLTINPTLVTGVYPKVWTQFSATLSGLPAAGVSGRFAFRYFVTDGGGNGTNSNCIGIDVLRYVPFVATCATATIATPASTLICPSAPTTLTVTGTGTGYQWNLNGNPIPGASGTTYAATQAGTYTVTATGPGGCTQLSTNNVVLTALTRPTANFVFDSYCQSKLVTFANQTGNTAGNSVTYAWSYGVAGATSTGATGSFTYADTGAYSVKLVATPGGCTALADSITRTINVETFTPGTNLPPINVKFNEPTEIAARDLGPGSRYVWDPPVMISSATVRNPIITAQREQLYTITITKASGCITIDTQLVRIFRDYDIFVPSAFSPDGDGVNDRLRPMLVGLSTLRIFRVFDRMGKEVYSSNTINPGWDGTINGKPATPDTYIWVADGYDQKGAPMRKSGNVLLVR
ncbi:MAG: gliding motility-associated C-terminal domain-containing protein [Chitinophagaceae bacterium]|nr:MAG: gliding motility-associated C-terminal domain-containing protein [Chitinophagaceae bacterium]